MNSEPSFEEALRDAIGSGELPYQPAVWEALNRRLDAHDAATARRPVPHRRQLYRWALPAAAACLVLGWMLFQKPVDGPSVKPAVVAGAPAGVHPVSTPAAPTHSEAVHPVPGALGAGVKRTRQAARAPVARASGPVPAPAPAPAPLVAAAIAADSSAPAQDFPLPTTTTVLPAPRLAAATDPPPGDGAAAVGAVRHRLAFDVNGGCNLGGTRTAFTVGVSVKRPLSPRLQVEAGVALVSGTYGGSQTRLGSAAADPGTSATVANGSYAPSAAPTEAAAPLLYLQAAPTLRYRLTDRISAGAGTDVQRLLSTASEASLARFNTGGALQPQWDFGVTGRVDYRLLRRLQAGFLYRASLGGTGDGPGTVVFVLKHV